MNKKLMIVSLIVIIIFAIVVIPQVLFRGELITTTGLFRAEGKYWEIEYQFDDERDQEYHINYLVFKPKGNFKPDISKVSVYFSTKDFRVTMEDLSKTYIEDIELEGVRCYKVLVGSVFYETYTTDKIMLDIHFEDQMHEIRKERLVLAYDGQVRFED